MTSLPTPWRKQQETREEQFDMGPEMDGTLSILPFDISFFHLSVLVAPKFFQ